MMDVAIIGGGPAALSAALNLKIRNKDFILLGGNEKVTGLMKAPQIDNYLGLKGMSGTELLKGFREHAISMGVEIRKEKAYNILDMGGYFSINTGNEFYEATSIIIATGQGKAKYYEGEKEYLGKGIGYCATCDGPLYRNKSAAIIAENEEGEEEANFLSEICSEVYYIPAYRTEPKLRENIKLLREKVNAIKGDGNRVQSLMTDRRELQVDAVFIIRNIIPVNQLIEGLELDEGSIRVDKNMAASIEGVFACGDCAGKPYQIAKAIGEGNVASLSAVRYIEKKNIDNNVNT
ncbi:MAG TPA: FAD-dependent oxidoreductase [Bacillota bacterium]|nr:FAD-dependent oxidoreductase [Bacillota bacterium]HOR85815.1 FAD-dependent oxidoreductase [Bacillota bacterium]HPL54580.1 FAD-dependent oxidoreductase [Bacillota bacterium]